MKTTAFLAHWDILQPAYTDPDGIPSWHRFVFSPNTLARALWLSSYSAKRVLSSPLALQLPRQNPHLLQILGAVHANACGFDFRGIDGVAMV